VTQTQGNSTQPQGSEVARLLTQIHAEYESATLGLTGLAYGTSQHTVITQKMERISGYHDELKALVGDAAIALVAQYLEDFDPRKSSSPVQGL
jgi:hypothetical protein